MATILLADLALNRLRMPWLAGGAADEPAHLATAVILHANLPATPSAWTAGFAAGSVAVDTDHIPLIPVRHKIRKDDPRPALHTLLAPAGIAVAACLTRGRAREAMFGLAAGTCAHFVRDVATGTGVAPLQPLRKRGIKLPRRGYEAAMGLLALRALMLER